MTTSRARAAALLAASVLLHVAALLFLLDRLARAPARAPASDAMTVVWTTPVHIPIVVPRGHPQVMRPAPRPSARRAPARAAAAPRPAAIASAAPATAADNVAPAAAEPVFDRQAALAAARKLATEPDPARSGTVGAELDKRRVYAETQDDKMGRTIASGKRSDCVKAEGGGDLLTPLLWLLDKKGHGCKL